MPLHTNDFANAAQAAAQPRGQGMEYHGVDIGAYIDYGAINNIIQAAIAKMPGGAVPPNASAWTATVVLHPGEGEGAAWIMEHNPYKTWRWMVAIAFLITSFIATVPVGSIAV